MFSNLIPAIIAFGFAALVIVIAGSRLSRWADMLADRTGLGEALFGESHAEIHEIETPFGRPSAAVRVVEWHGLKIATLAPENSTWMKEMRAGAEEISKRTEGRVQLKFYGGGVMGNDRKVLRKMRIGQLHGDELVDLGVGSRHPVGRAVGQAEAAFYAMVCLPEHLFRGHLLSGPGRLDGISCRARIILIMIATPIFARRHLSCHITSIMYSSVSIGAKTVSPAVISSMRKGR